MADFGIRFFLCNIFICVITAILLITKRVLKNHFTNRMQFNLWFLLLGLLAVPFMPFRPIEFFQIFSWFGKLKNTASSSIIKPAANINISVSTKQINDFALSVIKHHVLLGLYYLEYGLLALLQCFYW